MRVTIVKGLSQRALLVDASVPGTSHACRLEHPDGPAVGGGAFSLPVAIRP
jgi:hypothetical protein